ncbi:stalk domain-containing protein [Alkalihalobacillus oceani]|uniref:Stalk domain-containing protein n=2 Tax=Halalkalibacter oceani TaxID=1653776 RepID=A0A9X2DT22_9BACI|nr:stalk domain-containing protein [Halalkalibacter oceani]
MNPKQVYSYAQMERDMKKLAERYPDLIEYHVIGTSEFGRPIYAITLGNGMSTSYINGSNHAREWITTNLTMYMIDQYAQAYQQRRSIGGYDVKTLLDKHRIWFVPMLNPDGVMIQQQGLTSVPQGEVASVMVMNQNSSNFKRWKANGKGVDLNRQFNANWNNLANSPGGPSFANYKGKTPHSASEVKAVLELTEEIRPEMAVSYHSSGQILFWNFHQQGAQLIRDRTHARALSQMTGYRLMGEPGATGGGGYTDWFIQQYKKPAFTPEVSPYVGATNVPLANFDRIWQENRLVGLYVARESQKMFETRLRNTFSPVSIEVDGERIALAEGAFTVQNRTVVPLRSIFERLGASVKWNSANREVQIESSEKSIRLPVHRPYAYLDGERVELDVSALLVDNRTYVPVRFIAEALGAKVEWQSKEQTVRITTSSTE